MSAPIWTAVPGYEIYEVSNAGQVRSKARRVTFVDGRIFNKPEYLLKASVGDHGYPVVNLYAPGTKRCRTFMMHQLVMFAFVGPYPLDQMIRHLDGNKLNCRLGNLTYGTRSENERDKIRHGRSNRGERCGGAKLTQRQVDAIRVLLDDTDMLGLEIAARFGVSGVTISQIKSGRTWAA